MFLFAFSLLIIITIICRQAVDRLWNYTESLNILNKDHWKQSVNEKLKDFQLEVFRAVKEGGWDGSDETTTVELQWSFTGALLYSVTVITTIGQYLYISI